MDEFAQVFALKLAEANELADQVRCRIVRGDSKGRSFGSPRNPAIPTIDEFNPRFVDIPAEKIGGIMRGGRHGIFPEQAARIRQLSNEDLIGYRPTDPLSGHLVHDGFSVTGGHHRFAEIVRRVESNELAPIALVRVLLHD